MQRRTIHRLAAGVTAALLLVACGGGEDVSIEPGAQAGTETASEGQRLTPDATATDPNSDPSAAEPTEQGIAEGEPHPDSSEGAPQTTECSASGMMVAQVQPEGLTEAAAATYNAIRNAALACDYERLAELASDEQFTFSYGGSSDPAAFWAEVEANDSPSEPMKKLVEITGLPYVASDDGAAVWPVAHLRPNDDDAWSQLEGVYTPDMLDEWREMGSGYLGYRTAITPAGEWIYFVAGD